MKKKTIEKRKDKLISVKVSQAFYKVLVKYAEDTGIENVATAFRSLVVRQLRREGYISCNEAVKEGGCKNG